MLTSSQELSYDGDFVDSSGPLKDDKYQKLDFDNPFDLVAFFDKDIAEGKVTLYKWQRDVLKELADYNATLDKPCRYCLAASNGSGKDKFIIAVFAIWFILCKIRSRVIITTSSGTQLTSQTEPYVADLCNKVNTFFGQDIFKIRQRYIKCLLSGSEIRMFATDEKGKAEGYHPIDAYSEMAIIVNEAKSVTEDIHEALRRCTGYNYWLEISSCGEPKGFFYNAFNSLTWRTKKVTSYDCKHQQADLNYDLIELGEHSPLFRSKHLSLFTSIGGSAVIGLELINQILSIENFPKLKDDSKKWQKRIGIDLAAGGDENCICIVQGNKVLKEYQFRETDTVIGSNRIHEILNLEKISQQHEFIFADDGGVGRSMIDMLVHKGWNVKRIVNQWPALGDRKQYGNRGAENWYRVKRIIEERCFDLRGLSKKTLDQLVNRNFKDKLNGGKLILESKKEGKSHGRPSPDRADAFILAMTGLTVEDFLSEKVVDSTKSVRPILRTQEELQEFIEQNAYLSISESNMKRCNNSLRQALANTK